MATGTNEVGGIYFLLSAVDEIFLDEEQQYENLSYMVYV